MKLERSDLMRLAEIVREVTGNQVQEKNFSMLESRLRGRIIKLKVSSMAEYWRHFEAHELEEKEILQSLMTTHYTFFFREYVHFEALQGWLDRNLDRLKDRFANERVPVRIWSAACSRGQEAYSLAMFLEVNLHQKHGIPYEIIGSDIDPESVRYAANGVYPIKEVNTIPQVYVGAFWKKGKGDLKEFAAVVPELKKRTSFEVLNLLEIDSKKFGFKFDVIFCRNVFIYFSENNVRKIAMSLNSHLMENGVLMSGVSEPIRFPGWDLRGLGASVYSLESVAAEAKVETVQKQEAQDAYSVLCVDDSPTIQLLMKKIFAADKNCMGVDFAGNGQEARTRLDEKKYDVVTLDIHMPVVNGIEFLERFYQKKSDPPVLMVSSVNRSDVDLATKALSLGAFDYVEKPAMNNLSKSQVELLTKVKLALKSRHMAAMTTTAFDESISQKIVVPDASLCLRIVTCGPSEIEKLEAVVRGQKNEARSPALLVLWKDSGANIDVKKLVSTWVGREVSDFLSKQMFRPNHFYVAPISQGEDVFSELKVKNVSLQYLGPHFVAAGSLRRLQSVQVLVDEALMPQQSEISMITQLPISDMTPATSFPSLSVEFFANLRKAA